MTDLRDHFTPPKTLESVLEDIRAAVRTLENDDAPDSMDDSLRAGAGTPAVGGADEALLHGRGVNACASP